MLTISVTWLDGIVFCEFYVLTTPAALGFLKKKDRKKEEGQSVRDEV